MEKPWNLAQAGAFWLVKGTSFMVLLGRFRSLQLTPQGPHTTDLPLSLATATLPGLQHLFSNVEHSTVSTTPPTAVQPGPTSDHPHPPHPQQHSQAPILTPPHSPWNGSTFLRPTNFKYHLLKRPSPQTTRIAPALHQAHTIPTSLRSEDPPAHLLLKCLSPETILPSAAHLLNICHIIGPALETAGLQRLIHVFKSLVVRQKESSQQTMMGQWD